MQSMGFKTPLQLWFEVWALAQYRKNGLRIVHSSHPKRYNKKM